MATNSYSDGTIAVAGGSASVAGSGTAWTTQVKPADILAARIQVGGYSPTISPWFIVGWVESVDSDIAITLLDAYQGEDLSGAEYRIVRGYAWWTGAAPNETLITFLTELGALGLAGSSAGTPAADEGRDNELRVDYTNGILFQRRSGSWHAVATGFSFDAFGDSTGSPNDRDQYDGEAAGFTFFDIVLGGFYVKNSASSADWSALVSLQGAAGADGISGYQFTFSSTTTDADPGAGFWRLNHASPASATELYIDTTALIPAADISSIIAAWGNGTSAIKGLLTIAGSDDAEDTLQVQVTAVSLQSGYYKLSITYVGHTGTITSGDDYAFQFAATGDKGDTGATGSTGAQGIQGDQGPQGDPGNDGTSFNWRGAWQNGATYAVNDGVEDGGSSYVCITPHTASPTEQPSINVGGSPTYWQLFAEKGDTGSTGASGADGTDPGVLLTWDDVNTDSDPGAGNIRADNDTLSAAAFLYVSKTNRAGDDISTFLSALDDSTNPARFGGITLTRSGGNAQATFNLVSLTDASGYVKLGITGHSGATGFIDADAISFQFSRDGNKGSDGAGAVDSVNGQTGAVSLDAGDIPATDLGQSPSTATVQEVLDNLRVAIAAANAALLAIKASGVENDSAVSGATVALALNTLQTAIGALITGVSSFNSRTGAVSPASNDYAASQVSNDSSVAGSGVAAALNTLAAAILALVTGVSSVNGQAGAVTLVASQIGATDLGNSPSIASIQEILDNLRVAVAAVGPTSVQTLTNKTLTDPAIIGTILEDVYTISDGAGFEIDPGNGSIQLITLGASRTPAATNFAAGESVTLMVADGTAYTITWTTVGVVWVGGSAPTLATSGYTVIELWKVGSTIYGARVGDVA